MRQQHAFSLSTRIFSHVATSHPLFPDKAGCCFGLIRSFYYSFKTKAKVGTTSQRIQKNLPPCPPWSTNLPQLWPNDAPNEESANDMWGDNGPTSFISFSRTEKKNRCRIFHNGVRWREDSFKRPGELPSVRNERRVRGKKRKNSSSTSTDSNVNVNLESAWFWRARGCCKAATARL